MVVVRMAIREADMMASMVHLRVHPFPLLMHFSPVPNIMLHVCWRLSFVYPFATLIARRFIVGHSHSQMAGTRRVFRARTHSNQGRQLIPDCLCFCAYWLRPNLAEKGPNGGRGASETDSWKEFNTKHYWVDRNNRQPRRVLRRRAFVLPWHLYACRVSSSSFL